MNQFYIYQHTKADTNAIFYVGKGKGSRCSQKKGRNDYWHRVVNKHGFNHQIVVDGLDEELAFLSEIELIDKYKRLGIELVNATDGGEGASGYRHTEEHKSKMRGNDYWKNLKQVNFKGQTHSEESRAKMSASQLGNTNKLGKKISDEAKQKISLSRVGMKLSDEHKENISKSLIGNKHTAKLTDDQVRFVRANQGKMTHIELGQMFGIHKNTVHKIWRNERYKDVQ
jgi:hypothetical protein